MLEELQAAFRTRRVQTGPHAARRMLEHMIAVEDLITAVGSGEPEILEEYRDDTRGASCLLLGFAHGQPIHVVCTMEQPFFLITCYRPDPRQWSADFRERR